MNRKERAAPKHKKRLPAPASTLSRGIDEFAAEARRSFDRRDFASAQKLCKDILACAPSHVDRIKAAWPRRPSVAELFGAPGIAALANDVFLCCALETSRLDGLVVERFLTDVRWALLQIASDAAPAFDGIEPSIVNFCSALAQQYFRNEYVYAES